MDPPRTDRFSWARRHPGRSRCQTRNSRGKGRGNAQRCTILSPGGRRLFHWNAHDITYFLGCAVWNYFTLPALLVREDIVWTELRAGVLASEFPPEVPTHGPQQHSFDHGMGSLLQV